MDHINKRLWSKSCPATPSRCDYSISKPQGMCFISQIALDNLYILFWLKNFNLFHATSFFDKWFLFSQKWTKCSFYITKILALLRKIKILSMLIFFYIYTFESSWRGKTTLETIGQCLLELNVYMLYDSAIPLPVTCPREMCAYVHQKAHVRMLIAALSNNGPNWK